jgi:AraC-like DNA-binding protein
MPTQLRAATLTNFESVARECGLSAQALLQEVGLPLRCLHEPDLKLPAASVGALLELASQRANEPAFGLRMAASRQLSNLGALGLLLREQPTLRHVLTALVSHLHIHAGSLTLTLVEDGPVVMIREELLQVSGPAARQALEMAMVTTFRLLRLFLGESWEPRQVRFRHAPPRDAGIHHQAFGRRIAFGQEFNEIVCNADDLNVPNPSADPVMARYAQQLLEKEPGHSASMAEQVQRLIVLLLPRGHCRADIVAQHLGVTRRTIHNRLAAEGTTFKALVDQMRGELLNDYIDAGSRSLSEVAPLLGFSELSALSRWRRHQREARAVNRA